MGSWNYLCGKFMLLLVKAKFARTPFMKNSATEFSSAVHPNAEAVFGKDSFLFMNGPDHQAIRGSFLKLLTKKAVTVYLSIQETMVLQYIEKWKQNKGEVDLRHHLLELTSLTSQAAFVGPYIPDTERFQHLMKIMGESLVSLPINLPGSGVWRANRARVEVEKILTEAAKSCKKCMREGKSPSSFLDFWTQIVLNEVDKAEQNGESPPYYSSDYRMGVTVKDGMFAAQDAVTASLSQIVALMSDYPDILEKVREEQHRVNASKDPITTEMFQEMTYTRQVVKEILRFRPPVPLWAHIAMSDMEIEGYTAPKGCVVFSSISAACREDFTNPDTFDPDRMGPERQEDIKHCANYLVFGAGKHRCTGKEYAINLMVVFLAVLSTRCTWTRRRTAKSDEIEYMPSAYPADLFITIHDNSS